MTKPYVWDSIVRLTHWVVAALFLSNYFVTEPGSEIHEWAGYFVLAALSVRLTWGIITDSPARLSAFRPSVRQAISHLKEVLATKQDSHIGHNPAGAVMIWVMWLALISTGITGWATQLDIFWGEDGMKEIHEFFANLTMLAVATHICAVIFMTHWAKRSYVKSMLPQRSSDK
ncbi:cytochrome b/b6 domain-containing protein [Vibrio sp. H11]|uniref:cytochrome b/b6 domain-containing protein n=1 Tax=Vibrio sp. H11 TaxID=2565928 RepID=UPI0010A69848|nr:cytochrome b/b6 domain-containing protein [Vibrio sp. H11]